MSEGCRVVTSSCLKSLKFGVSLLLHWDQIYSDTFHILPVLSHNEDQNFIANQSAGHTGRSPCFCQTVMLGIQRDCVSSSSSDKTNRLSKKAAACFAPTSLGIPQQGRALQCLLHTHTPSFPFMNPLNTPFVGSHNPTVANRWIPGLWKALRGH